MKTKVIPQFVQILQRRLAERNPRIQIVLGPRQVGKSTGIGLLMRSDTKNKYHYVLGDGIPVAKWIQEQWQVAVEKGAILVIDEVQKIPDWSEVIKKLWDESQASKKKVKCVLLGSSSLYLQKGMSERDLSRKSGDYVDNPARRWTGSPLKVDGILRPFSEDQIQKFEDRMGRSLLLQYEG
jgi:predicted AAA+ superfamily ATPase